MNNCRSTSEASAERSGFSSEIGDCVETKESGSESEDEDVGMSFGACKDVLKRVLIVRFF